MLLLRTGIWVVFLLTIRHSVTLTFYVDNCFDPYPVINSLH